MKSIRYTKILILLVFCLCATNSLFAADWGLPTYLWIRTLTIEDYPGTGSDLNRCHEHGSSFADTMFSKITSRGYAISTSRADYKDSAATQSAIQGSDAYEMVFFSGHGNTSGPVMYDSTLTNTEKAFGSFTKWVFFDCCLALNTTFASMDDRFNGVHAIFGYDSIAYEFSFKVWDFWPFTSHYERSEQQWSNFSNRWAYNNQGMYDAYRASVQDDIVNDGGYDVDIACYHVRGTISGQYLYGHNENITNVYRNGLKISDATDGFWKTSTVWGSPDYN